MKATFWVAFFVFVKYAIMKLKSLIWLVLMLPITLLAQVPSGYYDSADGKTGTELKTALYNIIKGHIEYEYTSDTTDTWDILKEADQDPNNPDNVIGIYSGFSMDGAAEYAGGNGWTREHVWAKSRGDFGTDPGPGTDLHHIRAEDGSTNTARSNRTFAECDEQYIDSGGNYEGATQSYTSSTEFVWKPRDEVKGDVARMIFYMATRYEGENGEPDLEVVDFVVEQFSNLPQHGKLTDLLLWNQQDPVSDQEKHRNEVVFGYQENRNPFIDHPEWVNSIWGDVGPSLYLYTNDFSTDFGNVNFGDSYKQSYQVNGYSLEGDLTVSVEAPFYVSKDNSSFANSITFTHTAGENNEQFTVYMKFEPQQADGQSYTKTVTHSSTNLSDVTMDIQGKEGAPTIISIAEARAKPIGAVVDIVGVVIGGENNSSRSRVLYDGTAGIIIRSPDGADNLTGALVLGDSVEVTGGLNEYGDALQVNNDPMTVTLISQGATLPEPKQLTLSEIGEEYESQLAIIHDVTFADAGGVFTGGGTDGNFEITDGTGTLVLRIGNANHPLVGTTIPEGKCNITGYIGQFYEDYQLTPRTKDDIKPVGAGPGTIADARTKDDNTVVQVRGVVLGGGSNSELNRIVYDGTAGLVVRSSDPNNLSSTLVPGDSVVVSGGVLDYRGLFEIEQSVSIQVINQGNALPEYQKVTIDKINELYESELIRLDSVQFKETGTFETGEYTITDGDSEITFKVGMTSNPLVGMDIPEGTLRINGYVWQSDDTYQVLVDKAEDIVLLETPEVLAVGALKTINVYPNPVKHGVINLELKGDDSFDAYLLDFQGKTIKHYQTSKRKLHIGNMESGVYFLKIISGKDTYSQRIIVEK